MTSLGVKVAAIVGHSTGGMLAVRYGLMFPQDVDELALINPIGLEDWKAKGVPSLSIDQWYGRELNTAAETIRAYEKATYYAGEWRDSYEPWVQMLAGMYRFRALALSRDSKQECGPAHLHAGRPRRLRHDFCQNGFNVDVGEWV